MDGLLLINKDKDYTSRDVVNVINKYYDTPKTGHTGTLDPMATGVLVVAINKGVKLIDLVSCNDKEYIVEVKLGIITDTLDITGNILEEKHDFNVSDEELIECLKKFIGKNIQEVPKYSAIRVNGMRLYKYARTNREISLPKKEIEVYDIEFLNRNDDLFSFRVKVSKGTYIRSLVRDIGTKLNIPCTMNNLCRIAQGKYRIEDCVKVNDLANVKCISMKEALSEYKQIVVDKELETKIMDGAILENKYNSDLVVFLNNEDRVLAIYQIYHRDITKVKPLKVFK